MLCGPHLKRTQSKLRKIHTQRAQGIRIRSKLKSVGIIENITYPHLIHDRKRGKMKIINSYTDIKGQIVTGKGIYKAIRENYKAFYQKRY